MAYKEKTFELDELLKQFGSDSENSQSNEALDDELKDIHCSNYYIFDDEEASYEQLLQSCSPFEKSLLEEVAGGDYWLARSILHVLNKD